MAGNNGIYEMPKVGFWKVVYSDYITYHKDQKSACQQWDEYKKAENKNLCRRSGGLVVD